MPTFTAIALDRLLEPGVSRSRDNSASDSPASRPPRKPETKRKHKNVPNSNLERRHSIASTIERKVPRPLLNPELYATPQATPLPDSPTSLTPSPYIINHKRRGPHLLKSFSEDDVASRAKSFDEENGSNDGKKVGGLDRDGHVSFSVVGSSVKEVENGFRDSQVGSIKVTTNGGIDEKISETNSEVCSGNVVLGKGEPNGNSVVENDPVKLMGSSPQRDSENEDFPDPLESLSYASIASDGEENNAGWRGLRSPAQAGDFYDAWDDLSSDGGTQSSVHDVEMELHELRFSLLMEIEKCKHAEEALINMRAQWGKIREQLFPVGLTLPACPTSSNEDEQINGDTVEELCQQVTLARYVSESIGRGLAKAESEIEMEAQIESKNFEIARLMDRLHYYEAVNQEMSQRNQEAIETARRNRQDRKRKQKWVWGSIATVITVGTAALLWSYLPSGRASTLTNHPEAHKNDGVSK